MANRDQQLETLRSLVEPICAAHGVELVDVRFLQMKGMGVVRVFIDREGNTSGPDGSGVTVDDCTSVSRDLSTALDVHGELISGKYNLEVSSPGLDRPLVKLKDFVRFTGREIKLQTQVPINERRKFNGELLRVNDQTVLIEQDGAEVEIPFEDIAKANLVYRFQ